VRENPLNQLRLFVLFAIGFTIQLERLERRAGSDARWSYVRRLLVLFAIGIAHAVFVWNGDVLHSYALLGSRPLTRRSGRATTPTRLHTICRRVALMVFYVVVIVRLAMHPRWLSWMMPLAAARACRRGC
jgi:uncharacterized protein